MGAHADIQTTKKGLDEALAGSSPEIKVESFKNWGETVHIDEVLACYPKNLADIQNVVRACRKVGVRVRAAGTTHSWSPVYTDPGNLVLYTKKLKNDNKEAIQFNKTTNEVTVLANVTTGQLMHFELENDICLTSNVILRSVTYGGVLATICHGVGKDCKTVSDYITAIRIVDSDGNLRTYSDNHDTKELMLAVKGNLGLFGIIYDITLKLEPLIIAEVKDEFHPVSKVFYDKDFIKKIMADNWSVELFWFPFNSLRRPGLTALFGSVAKTWDPNADEVWVRMINKCPPGQKDCTPEEMEARKDRRDRRQEAIGKVFGKVVTHLHKFTPAFLAEEFSQIKKDLLRLPGDPPLYEELPNAIHYRDGIDKMPVYDMEWAMNCDSDFNNFMQATQHVIKRVKEEAAENKYPLNLAMEMRLIGSSDIYLAPAQAGNPSHGGSGQTLYIEILSMVGTDGWKEFTSDVAKFWMTLNHASTRPHWAKEWSDAEGVDEHMMKLYDAEFTQFLHELRSANVDPDGIFLNQRLQSLLGWKAAKIDESENKHHDHRQPAQWGAGWFRNWISYFGRAAVNSYSYLSSKIWKARPVAE